VNSAVSKDSEKTSSTARAASAGDCIVRAGDELSDFVVELVGGSAAGKQRVRIPVVDH
jgi:hypothetical protein